MNGGEFLTSLAMVGRMVFWSYINKCGLNLVGSEYNPGTGCFGYSDEPSGYK